MEKTLKCIPPVQSSIALIDFEKAFDSIDHDSLRRTLNHIGSPSRVTNVILNLLNNAQTKIRINGALTNPFKTERGTRQGDPLSSSLFILSIKPPPPPPLTKGQKRWLTEHKMNWTALWKLVHKIKSPRPRAIMWRILNRCTFCGEQEDIDHLFNCIRIPPLDHKKRKEIQQTPL